MEPAGVMENKCDPSALQLKSMHICTSYCVPPNFAISCDPIRGGQSEAAGAPVLSDLTPVSCCVAVPLRPCPDSRASSEKTGTHAPSAQKKVPQF